MEPNVVTLLIEFGAIVLGFAIAARIAHRLGLAVLPVYLSAGLAFSEGGLIEIGAANEFIEVGAQIGVILMLLMLGLEFSAHELIDKVRQSATPGLADLVLNFAPGLVAGLLLGFDPVVAVLLGGITYISSSGVFAKVVADLNRTRNPETPTVLSILVIEDLAMVLFLPVITGFLVGGSLLQISLTVAISIVCVLTVLTVAYHHSDRISALVLSNSPEVLLLTLVGVSLLFGGLAERLHISAAVGAFILGIALSGDLVDHARELLFPLRHLFAASFFIFFGLQVDTSLIGEVALAAAALAAVTTLTKLATGWYAARSNGLGQPARALTGAALVAHGEFSIVIAELGAEQEPNLAAFAATYVIILAIVGSVLYQYADTLLTRRTPTPA